MEVNFVFFENLIAKCEKGKLVNCQLRLKRHKIRSYYAMVEFL